MTRELLRRFRFKPYRKGLGPTFTVEVFDANERRGHHNQLETRLVMHENGKSTVIFEDFSTGVPGHQCVDSPEALSHACRSVCIKPGDTDEEFFSDYTQEQRDWASQYGENLEIEMMMRFGEYE